MHKVRNVSVPIVRKREQLPWKNITIASFLWANYLKLGQMFEYVKMATVFLYFLKLRRMQSVRLVEWPDLF